MCLAVGLVTVGLEAHLGNDRSQAAAKEPGQVLAEAGFAGLALAENQDGIFTIEGYLDKAEHRRKLMALLHENGIQARIRVYSMEKLVSSCTDFFTRAGHRIQARAGGRGEIVLTGQAPDKAGVEKILGRIKKDVPGILGFVDRIAYGLGKPSSPSDTRGALSGTTGSRPAQVPRLSILSVSLGQTPSMVLGDGRRYFEGSRIKPGFLIKKIDSHGIVLEKGNQTAIYHIGGE